MSLSIIHVTAGLWRDTGGPSEVIPNLCAAQAAAGANVTLCCIDGDNAPQLQALPNANVEVKLFPTLNKMMRFSPQMAKYLKLRCGVDVIHNHGHWLWPNWYASHISQKSKSILVTTPHGALVPIMLVKSSVKKRLAWQFFDKKLIKRADLVHSLSPSEYDAMAPKVSRYAKKMIVLPNGVNIGKDAGQFTAQSGGTLLFLSRVAPIKGVIQLLTAWASIAPKFPNWELRMVGPIDKSIELEVKAICSSTQGVTLAGPIYHEERWSEFRKAAGFILPTLGEGLPTVLLEAAAHQLPVITTKEANFHELFEAGGSMLTTVNPDDIGATLTKFFNLPSKDRKMIGMHGENLIKSKYGWSDIASQWLKIYEDLRSNRMS